jgi:hypothetical protein
MPQSSASPDTTSQASSAGLELGPTRLWSLDIIDEILAGTRDPRLLRTADRKGMTAASYAAMAGARAADRLMPLLQLLEAPEEGEDRIALLQQTLSALAEAQLRLEAKLDAVIVLLTDAASSRPGSGQASAGSVRKARSGT